MGGGWDEGRMGGDGMGWDEMGWVMGECESGDRNWNSNWNDDGM